jgi:hypothetical protein
MTGKSIRELTLDAIDQALAESIRQLFISMALADPTDDGGTPLALKRFNRSLPHLANLHKRARTMTGDIFKEERHSYRPEPTEEQRNSWTREFP